MGKVIMINELRIEAICSGVKGAVVFLPSLCMHILDLFVILRAHLVRLGNHFEVLLQI